MKTISFVIPCYNEEKRIEKTFTALRNVKIPAGLKLEKIIFVNDGSTDGTLKKMNAFAKRSKISTQIVSYKKNRGKGRAIKVGMLESKSDYALFFDADMSTPLSELSKFKESMESDVEVIVGTRKNGHSTVVKHQPLYRELMGKVFTQLTRFVLQVKVTDFTCGFKAFSRKALNEVFQKAQIEGWGYDAEILFIAQDSKLSIVEVPVTWANDARTKVNLSSAVLKTLMELGKIRWIHTFEPIIKGLNIFNFIYEKA